MAAKNKIVSQNFFTKLITSQSGHKIYVNTCVAQRNPFQRGSNIYLNRCFPNASHGSENTKFFPACVDQTSPMPMRTLNASQLVLSKSIPGQRGKKCNSTTVEQIPPKIARTQNTSQQYPPMPARTQNVSQLELRKRKPKTQFNLY